MVRYLIVPTLMFIFSLNPTVVAGTFFDDFEDNALDKQFWVIMKTDGWTKEKLKEENGRIEYSDFVGDWEGIGIRFDHPLNMNDGSLTIEFDIYQRIQDFHPYITNAVTEGGLWNLGIFAFNVDSEVLGFEKDKTSGASANPEPNIPVDSKTMHHFKYVYTPKEKAGEFDFLILVDDGATGKAEGILNAGTIDPKEVYIYFEVEHDDWAINEFVYLDNVVITSDSIEGNIGPGKLAVAPMGKLASTWGTLKLHR